MANARLQVQALEAGGGQHDGVVPALVELAKPGVQVAAQGLDVQVGPQGLEQHQPAQAGRADHGALRQFGQRCKIIGHKGVARVFARQDAGQREAFGQVHRHVLERMHRQVGPAFAQRDFKLLDEQALAADLAERAVQNLVAQGGHAQQLDLPAQTRL